MIGVFDSGVGGLTVVKELEHLMPECSYIYWGDTARYPYGAKSKETIERYAIENTRFLLERGATVIMVACNTASALALDALRIEFPKVPIFDVLTPAVARAAEIAKKKVGILATRGTVASGAYERALKAIRNDLVVVSQAAPLLVPLVEEGWTKRPETQRIVRAYCEPLRAAGVDTVILGCTHFPLLKNEIHTKLRRAKLIDSGKEAAQVLAEYITKRCKLPSLSDVESRRFYFTDVTPHVETIARRWLGRAVTIEKVAS